MLLADHGHGVGSDSDTDRVPTIAKGLAAQGLSVSVVVSRPGMPASISRSVAFLRYLLRRNDSVPTVLVSSIAQAERIPKRFFTVLDLDTRSSPLTSRFERMTHGAARERIIDVLAKVDLITVRDEGTRSYVIGWLMQTDRDVREFPIIVINGGEEHNDAFSTGVEPLAAFLRGESA